MLRGKVTNVTSAGVFVQTADYGTVGPCQAVNATYAVGDAVLCVNVGDDVAPDLVVVGIVSAAGGAFNFQTAKASNYWRMNVTSGNGNLYLDVASGAQMAVMYRTGNSNRWFVGKTSTSESGSNAGSNFLIYAYNDSGGGIGNCLEINRSSRRVTISNAATTAGIELGSSGPTITTGTGAPSHSAPNGSIYLRTDGTATTTLYVRAGGAWTALS
jgi:hypothetical protein